MNESRTKTVVLAAVSAIVVCVFVVFSLWMEAEPMWILLGAVSLVAGVVLVVRFPGVLLAALLFVGNLKTEPASGLSVRELITDPTLMCMVLLAGALLVEGLLAFAGQHKLRFRALFRGQGMGVAAFLSFVAVVAISYSYTAGVYAGSVKLSRFLTMVPLVFFAPFILFKSEKDVRQFMKAVLVLSLVLGAKTIFGLLHPTITQQGWEADVTRIGDGQLLGVTILALLYYRFLDRFSRAALILCLPFLGAAMIASIARGPIVSLLVVIAVSFFAFRRRTPAVTRRSIRIGVILFLVVASGALLWVAQLPSARAKFTTKSQELQALITDSGSVGGTAGKRISFYQVALRAFEDQPLLGHGVGSWGVLYYGEDRRAHAPAPHNLLLEVAAEEGLLGLAALGAFFLAAFGAMRKIRKSGPEFLFLLPIFAFCVLVSMFSSDIVNRPIWAWFAMVFVAARMIELRKPAPLAGAVPVRRSGMEMALGAPVGASWKA